MAAMLHTSVLAPHLAPRITSGERYWRVWMSLVKWWFTQQAFPRSAILTLMMSQDCISSALRFSPVVEFGEAVLSSEMPDTSLVKRSAVFSRCFWFSSVLSVPGFGDVPDFEPGEARSANWGKGGVAQRSIERLAFMQHLAEAVGTGRGEERGGVEARVERRRQGLAARDECPPPPAAVPVVLLVVGLVLDHPLDDLLDVADLDQHVFRLEVGMDDAALPMQVVEPQEDLFCDLLDQRHRDAPMIPLLDQAQQVLAQDLKHHAHVCAIRALVLEGVQQADDMFAAGVVWVGLDDLVEQLDLVDGCLGIVGGGPHDLEGDVFPRGVVLGQPDGGEVAPAQLADDCVFPFFELLPDGDGVVASLAVVLRVLLVGGVLGGVLW